MTFIPSYIIAYSNSDFTNPHEVVLPDEPKDCREVFTHAGAKYWGIETCRHKATQVDRVNKKILYNHNNYHWLELGFRERAKMSTVQVSTKWFTGNQVRAISVILIDELFDMEVEVLTNVSLQPDQEHTFTFSPTVATKCMIKIFYEGGISRINFFGDKTTLQLPNQENLLEKAKISHVSNEHYGNPAMAVSGNRKEMHMVGWESARTGFGEQAIFHLQQPAKIREIVVDTYLHRFNAPLTCYVFGLLIPKSGNVVDFISEAPRWSILFEDGHQVVPDNFQDYMLNQSYLKENTSQPTQFEISLFHPFRSAWKAILPFAALTPDTYHQFSTFDYIGPFSHLLYMHYPNGGIHGLKVFSADE